MKKLLSVLLLFMGIAAQSQINKVVIQASGLTCSMCSNSINKALKSIEYVDKVVANIKNSSFEITFKPSASVSFDQLKKKVEAAGFFVAKFEVSILFKNVVVSKDAHIEWNGTMYHFLDTGDRVLNEETTIRVLDKGFVSAKEFKRNSKLTSMECYQTGVMGKCCDLKNKSAGVRIYHVTI